MCCDVSDLDDMNAGSSTNDDNDNDENIGHIVTHKEIKRRDQIS